MFACNFCNCCRNWARILGSTLSSPLFVAAACFGFPDEGTAGTRLEILDGAFGGFCCCGVPTTEIVPVTSLISSFVQTFLGFGLDAAPDPDALCAADAWSVSCWLCAAALSAAADIPAARSAETMSARIMRTPFERNGTKSGAFQAVYALNYRNPALRGRR